MVAEVILAGAALGGVSLGARLRERAAEGAWPPVGRFVKVEGRRVHAWQAGQGPDVVLIHGAGGNLRDFTFALAGRLARFCRVTAFDRPGLGYSDDLGPRGTAPGAQAWHLRAAAAMLGVQGPVVLGHSYGGAVAMAWALDDPGGTRGVVALAGATMPWPGGLDPWYHVTGGRVGGALAVPLLTALAPDARIAASLCTIFAPDPVPPGYADHFGPRLTLRRGSLRASGRQVLGLKPHVMAMAARYPSLEVPVELVHGTADTTVPARVHAMPLSALLPSARLTLIEGAGHMPHHSHPEAVETAVGRLL